MTNLCRDEVTAVLKDKIESIFGASFNTNGLGAGEHRIRCKHARRWFRTKVLTGWSPGRVCNASQRLLRLPGVRGMLSAPHSLHAASH